MDIYDYTAHYFGVIWIISISLMHTCECKYFIYIEVYYKIFSSFLLKWFSFSIFIFVCVYKTIKIKPIKTWIQQEPSNDNKFEISTISLCNKTLDKDIDEWL